MITPITLDDLPRILEIEKLSYDRPWSEGMFQREFSNPIGIAFGFRDGNLLGYIFAWMIFEDLHINNIAVDPGVRRRGIGSALLSAVITKAQSEGGGNATLEVRPSNSSASSLYTKFGFERISVRPGYYEDTGEDGIVLGLKLTPTK